MLNSPGSESGLIGKSGGIGYEEGSWTPAISAAGGLHSGTVGKYTKIGRQVTLTMWIGFANDNDGNCQITGLPFTAMVGGDTAVTVAAYNLKTGTATTGNPGYVGGYLSGNDNQISINLMGRTDLPYTYLTLQDSGSRFFASLVYMTA